LAKRLGKQQTLARGSYFPPQGFAQVPAAEVDELSLSARLGASAIGRYASAKRFA
jgi:hypothetical protein